MNTTYRGPATPGSAAALAFGLAVPDENAVLMKKLRGGIGALTTHLATLLTDGGGELRLRCQGRGDLHRRRTGDRGATRRRHRDQRADRRLRRRSRPHRDRPARRRSGARRGPGSLHPGRSPRQLPADALRARRHARPSPTPYGLLNDPQMQAAIGLFSTPEELQQQWEDSRRGIVPADPGHRVADAVGAGTLIWRRRASTRSRRSRCGSRSRSGRRGLRRPEGRDGAARHRQDHPARTGFREPDLCGTPHSPRNTWAPCSARPAGTTATA